MNFTQITTPLTSVFALIDVGFEIPNLFVVGYALDYNEYFRDLNVSPEFAVPAAQRVTFWKALEKGMKEAE